MLQEFNRNAKYRPLISVKKLKDVNSGAKYDGFGVFYDGVSVDGGEPQQIPFPAGFPLFEYVGELVFGKKWEDREKHPSFNVSSYFASIAHKAVIDAFDTRISNWSRYINRHCFPCLTLQKWTINCRSALVFHALIDIPIGAELTFHYTLRKNLACGCDAGKFCRKMETHVLPPSGAELITKRSEIEKEKQKATKSKQYYLSKKQEKQAQFNHSTSVQSQEH
jgi:hypothetical protein